MEYTAAQFVERLESLRSPDATGPDDYHGVGMGQIFSLARECMDMAPAEIERLLESPTHAVRVGAVSIMDFQARDRKASPERKRELFELYLRRHDRIDTWDLVDRSAIWVVGEYLVDKPRDVLDQLAASDQPMERRTAILAPLPLSAATSSTTRTGSRSCSSTTPRTPCTRRSAGCCARPASGTRIGRPRSSRRTPRRCRE